MLNRLGPLAAISRPLQNPSMSATRLLYAVADEAPAVVCCTPEASAIHSRCPEDAIELTVAPIPNAVQAVPSVVHATSVPSVAYRCVPAVASIRFVCTDALAC